MRAVSKAGLRSIAVLGLLLADGAAAQRVVRHGPGATYPVPRPTSASRPAPPLMVRPAPMAGRARVLRWGNSVGGQWSGGVNAPGGYRAYRRPYRGWALPPYWVSPRFGVSDWGRYGLTQPLPGYRWTRYYDDAVLIDARGSVYDSRGGIDWDGRDDGYAGNLVYDEGRGPGPRGYERDYPPVGHGDESRWVSPDGTTTVTTASGGYGGGTTVVTVQGAPVVTTTTTTEMVEDAVTYTPRKTYRRKYARRSPKYLRR